MLTDAMDPVSTSDAALRDTHEITQQIYHYCRAMDRRDVALGYSVFHDDAVADYGEGFYTGTGHGFIDWVTALHGNFLAHSHQMTNILIELAGDRAASESYAVVALRQQDGAEIKQITSWCRYLDSWSRRDGRWAIDKRMIILDLNESRPIAPFGAPSRGRRDPSDPSYALFASLNASGSSSDASP